MGTQILKNNLFSTSRLVHNLRIELAIPSIMKKSILFLLLLVLACTKDDKVTSFLDSFNKNKYFDEEVLIGDYQNFYGLWKVIDGYGGWSGYFKPDFDFLEIKQYGIYGVVRNDTLIEYGKIFPNEIEDNFVGIPVKLDPEYYSQKYSTFRSTMYFEICRTDTLCIYNGLVEGISYSFNRIKK
jgi:hypothetical protein